MLLEADQNSTVVPDPTELEQIAFSGRTELLHDLFRKIPRQEREALNQKHILLAVIRGGIQKLRKFREMSAEREMSAQMSFLNDITTLFLLNCKKAGSFPREIFEALLEWSEELQRFAEFDQAFHYLGSAVEAGIRRYPDLHIRLLLCKASLLETLGRFGDVDSLLAPIAERPYLIPDRNLVPQIFLKLAKAKLRCGQVNSYRKVLIGGLRSFYSNLDDRWMFVEQLRKNYRSWTQMLADPKISSLDRVLFFIHLLYFYFRNSNIIRFFHLQGLLRLCLMAYVYSLNYSHADSIRSQHRARQKNILITRATGGIGDFLMMTPGFHRLKRKYPKEDLVFAIPRQFFPVFQGNSDVCVVDIEDPDLRCSDFRKWFNFTDCPASRVESRTAPRVRASRIDIFARALGLSRIEVWQMDKRPRYFLSEEEMRYREEYWRRNGLHARGVIGVQLSSAELYRNYPFMKQLVTELARDHVVLVFDSEPISGFDDENVIRVEGFGVRRAFAIASGCDAIIAPDSVFVHLAAALDIPTVALYGPIDGKVRTKYYPKCLFLDARAKLQCIPCWRNEVIPCRLTNMRTSICMSYLTVPAIQEALREVLTRNGGRA